MLRYIDVKVLGEHPKERANMAVKTNKKPAGDPHAGEEDSGINTMTGDQIGVSPELLQTNGEK